MCCWIRHIQNRKVSNPHEKDENTILNLKYLCIILIAITDISYEMLWLILPWCSCTPIHIWMTYRIRIPQIWRSAKSVPQTLWLRNLPMDCVVYLQRAFKMFIWQFICKCTNHCLLNPHSNLCYNCYLTVMIQYNFVKRLPGRCFALILVHQLLAKLIQTYSIGQRIAWVAK